MVQACECLGLSMDDVIRITHLDTWAGVHSISRSSSTASFYIDINLGLLLLILPRIVFYQCTLEHERDLSGSGPSTSDHAPLTGVCSLSFLGRGLFDWIPTIHLKIS